MYRLVTTAFLLFGATGALAQGLPPPDTVVVSSGPLRLRAILWCPPGVDPVPAILFNHGSGHVHGDSLGGPDHRHPELLGPVFARHGYAFLYLYRRGDGLSADAGRPSATRMDSALAAGGLPARNALQLRLLETDELQDALAGLTYLRGLPRVDPSRVAVVGHSFGASLTLLLADRDSTVRAVVAFAPAGLSWNRSPELRARLTTAVERMPMHALFLHARNDYSIDGGIELAAAMRRQGRPGRVTIYPAVGRTPDDGHDFIHLQVQDWEPEVFAFLDSLLTPVPVPP